MTAIRPPAATDIPRTAFLPFDLVPIMRSDESPVRHSQQILPEARKSTANVSSHPDLRAGEAKAGTDPERFARLAGMLETATENLVGGVDVALALLTVFFSLPVSMRRLEGHIEHDEAAALVEGAKGLPMEDQRALALALSEMMDAGVLRLHKPFDKEAGEGAQAILTRYIQETLAAGEPTAADRAVGALLASVDTVQIALSDAHTHLSSADRDGRAVDVSALDLTPARVEALRVSLERVPESMRETARGLIRARLENYSWPANAAEVPALNSLRAIAT